MLAAGAAGALCGAALGALGGLVEADVRLGAGALVATALLAVTFVPGLEPLQLRRETGEHLLGLHPLAWGAVNGALLGVGVTSRIAFWVFYLVPLGCFVLGSPLAGAAIWGVYGAARLGASAIAARAMRRWPAENVAVADRLLAARPRADALGRAALGVLAVAMSLQVGL